MDQTEELRKLRHVRDVNCAIRDLEAEASHIAKRYRRGIKDLQRHAIAVETEIDDNIISGTGAIETASPDLLRLIKDPTLDNIAEDTSV